MSFSPIAYAQLACPATVLITVSVDPFSFDRKCLFFGFFIHVYEN